MSSTDETSAPRPLQPSRPLSADIALASMTSQTITVDPATYDELVAELERPPRTLPKLADLLARSERWS